jgi:hypothetical protein
MVASQVVDYGGPGTILGSMLPVFAFAGNASFVHPQASIKPNTTQVTATPIKPGTVNYQNTWNNTLALSCTLPKSISQPLSLTLNSWSASVEIPSQLFMFGSSGSFIEQNYTVYSNGTISVRDGSDNHFTLSFLIF